MSYGPRILNLRLCFMKGRVIRYTRSNLLTSVLHPKLYKEEAQLYEPFCSRKLDTQLFRKYQDLR